MTELSKEKQGIAIALSLPENDATQIREKVFDHICIDDLKEEDGLDTLTAFLDKHLKRMILRMVYRNLKSLRTFREIQK